MDSEDHGEAPAGAPASENAVDQDGHTQDTLDALDVVDKKRL